VTKPPLLTDLQEGRRQFLALVRELRPDLHRYAARMTGSVADGEDIVQETLARAYYALSELETLPELRPWLFRIAQRCALDHLRRYEVRMSEPLERAMDRQADEAADPENVAAAREATSAAISRFLTLAPSQRNAVILKDVLGHSLEEIAALSDTSVLAVKAALHRGRDRLREANASSPLRSDVPGVPSAAVARYASLFNARDWDGVRAMLAEDVKLDLVSRSKRAGKPEVGHYFTNYAKVSDWHLVPAWLEGREVLAVFRRADDAAKSPGCAEAPAYFVELEVGDDGIRKITDYRYVEYILYDAEVRFPPVIR
jgi:RNA polymerase sigma factor (sigma-70 family)